MKTLSEEKINEKLKNDWVIDTTFFVEKSHSFFLVNKTKDEEFYFDLNSIPEEVINLLCLYGCKQPNELRK